ncbi:phospholipase DDHD1-like isoform X1 [Tubulanus polymorphus]|uniref:phospholipase DDHD1-like isoform X1 n=1 Tax=Tubulanus polymorphus TaxID=672921 RepID=UPI003DA24FBD
MFPSSFGDARVRISSSDMDQFGDPLSESDFPDDDIYMDEASSEISDVSSRPGDTPSSMANLRRYLYPVTDTVEALGPEEIRWFYKEDGAKKWTPFIGYDSLRIECKYRELHFGTGGKHEDNIEMIVVRGGLYEVDVVSNKCYPIYWTAVNQTATIMRACWFIDGTWQPLEEGYAAQIETEHLSNFEHQKFQTENPVAPQKGQKKVIHHMKFKEFHVDWYAVNEIYMFSEATSSRLVRSVGHRLGIQKSAGGTRLYRGYYMEARPDDKPADITHLVFVIHGIGQKMETGSIIRSCKDLRANVNKLRSKYFPDLDSDNQRAEYLPVEWRSSLKLDGGLIDGSEHDICGPEDTVDSITPTKVRGLRTILNSSAMDILYYTSPLYRSEITHGLQTELNRLYSMFCARHPYFEPNGGKVSIVAHSLGCVIMYDIIMGWNPIQMYDQYVAHVIGKNTQKTEGAANLVTELDAARKRVTDLEMKLLSLAEKEHLKVPTLRFKLENFFCLGSPLAVFLALRGVRPKGNATQDHILPRTICNRLFNIYHPADPVAYRLEPLLLKHYSGLKPLKIHRVDTAKVSEPYTSIKAEVATSSKATNNRKDESNEKNNNNQATEVKPKGSISNRVASVWAKFSKKSPEDELSAEMERIESSAQEIEKRMHAKEMEDAQDYTSTEHTDLEYRLDYQLQEGSLENSYLAVLTSHTAYWTNQDIGLFILTNVHPDYTPKT